MATCLIDDFFVCLLFSFICLTLFCLNCLLADFLSIFCVFNLLIDSSWVRKTWWLKWFDVECQQFESNFCTFLMRILYYQESLFIQLYSYVNQNAEFRMSVEGFFHSSSVDRWSSVYSGKQTNGLILAYKIIIIALIFCLLLSLRCLTFGRCLRTNQHHSIETKTN